MNSAWSRALTITWPSVARGFVYMFVRGMRETTMALMLYAAGNQTLAVTLWILWTEEGRLPLASAIAVPMMLITILLSFFVASQTMLVEGGK